MNPRDNACFTCKAFVTLDWTGETDNKKKGRCLCQQGAINAGGDGCDFVCDSICGSCQQAGADKCYTCTFADMTEGTRAADGTLDTCTSPYTGACHGTCATCGGPTKNHCFTCADWTANGPGLSRHINTCTCPAAHFPDLDTSTCKGCGTNCATCDEEGDDKCTSCPNTADWDLIQGPTSGVGTCRRKCHASCEAGKCTEPHLADKCTKCSDPLARFEIVDQATSSGTCSSCYETCLTCSVDYKKDKCLTCKDLGAAGTLTLLNGECQCEGGTYYIEGEARCAACHTDCEACEGLGSNQCAICSAQDKLIVPALIGGNVGSCSSVYKENGSVKEEFFDRVDTPTITNPGSSGITVTSISNYQVALSPGRTPSAADRYKIPVTFTTTTLSRIKQLGSQFNFRDLITLTVEDMSEGSDFTVTGALSEDRKIYDLIFNIKKKEIQFLTVQISFINNNYLFKNLPTVTTTTRILQDSLTENQKLISSTPLIANASYRATITAQTYNETGTSWMKAIGAVLRVIIYILALGATIKMIITTFTNKHPQTALLHIAKYLELIFTLSWIVKVAFIPAHYSIYELVFLDELAKTDTLLMGEVSEEREIRSSLGSKNKFLEYNIPILMINSAAVMGGILLVALVCILVAKVVSLARNAKKPSTTGSTGGTNTTNKNHRKNISNNNNNNNSIEKRVNSSETNNASKKEKTKIPPNPTTYTNLVLITISLVTPTLFFYSTVGVWWNSQKGTQNWFLAFISSLLGLVIFSAFIITLVAGWGGYAFYLLCKGEIISEKDSRGQQIQILTERPDEKYKLEKNKNKEPEVLMTSGQGQNQPKTVKNQPNTTNSTPAVTKAILFEVWRLWISLSRFTLMMIIIVTQQNNRVLTMNSLITIQVLTVLCLAGSCFLEKKVLLSLPQSAFECCLFLLVLIIRLREAPDNRIIDNVANNFLNVFLPTLTFAYITLKIVEEVSELLFLVDPKKDLIRDEEDRKEKEGFSFVNIRGAGE